MKYEFEDVLVNTRLFNISKAGLDISTEPKVFDLVVYLIEHRHQPISRDELFENIWQGREVSDTSLSNHIKTARKILGDNGDEQRVIKTLRGRGYQFVAQVKEIPEQPDEIIPTTLIHKRLYQSVIGLLVIALVTLLYLRTSTDLSDVYQMKRIAVLPFSNLKPNKDTDYLGFAVADQIIGELAYLREVSVRGSASIRQFQLKNVDPVVAGKSLQVDYVLVGTYLTEKERIRLNVELIEVTSNKMLWRKSIEEAETRSFQLQTKITKQLTQQLNLQFSSSDLAHKNTSFPSSPLSYEFYLRAIVFPDTNQGAKMAIAMLNRAVELDANFAPLYAELGKRTHFLATFNLNKNVESKDAIEFYQKALALNPQLNDAISGLARIYAETGNAIEAVYLTQKLISINPNNANAHFTLGYIYRYGGMLQESIAAFEKAVALDRQTRWSHNLGLTYSMVGEYKKAFSALQVGQQTPYSLGWQATIYLHQGELERSLELLNKIILMEPDSFWELDSLGFKGVIEQDFELGLAAVRKLEAANVEDGEALFYWASLYAMLGDKDGCIRLLERATQMGYFNYPLLETEEFFDNMRNDSRFKKLLSQVKKEHLNFKRTLF
jgi:DNA-binding winged helix-turn-helix (wHTH) protein/TolB-like protein